MLTPDEKQFYDENGYVLRQGLVSPEEIEKVQAEIHNIHSRMAKQSIEGVEVAWEEFDDPNMPPRIKQLMQSELVSPTLNKILRSGAMLDIIEQLIGPDISLFHSKLLPK
ncbi:hypothetical protein J4G02_10390, partial [Candidatus Poribacteria bacterium]|nr:hypothetical protein [Candidatus Poribacteria bacterium]